MNAPPVDPVLPVQFTLAGVAFEQAPLSLVHECKAQPRGRIWILAATPRPEGVHMLISGPIWYRGEDDDEPIHLATDDLW
jgi:hypothetical protein